MSRRACALVSAAALTLIPAAWAAQPPQTDSAQEYGLLPSCGRTLSPR